MASDSRCEACGEACPPQQLTLSMAGQRLCRRCSAYEQSERATRAARKAAPFRLCTCGAVLTPEDAGPRDVQWNTENALAEVLLRPLLYRCGHCPTQFRIQPLFVPIGVFLFAVAILWKSLRAPTQEEPLDPLFSILFFVGSAAYLLYLVFPRLRYPRV